MSPTRPIAARPRGGAPSENAFWPCVAISAGLHVAVLVVFAAVRGAGLLAGAGVPWGDGFGGHSVEFEIAGPEDGPPVGSISSGRQPDVPERSAVPSEPAESEPALDGELAVRAPVRASARRRDRDGTGNDRIDREAAAVPERDRRASGDPTREEVAAPGAAAGPRGSGAEDSTAGATAGEDVRALILGSAGLLGGAVSQQRALLPNGGVCSDPVAGTWRAQKYRAWDRSWVRFTLRIRRDGDQLHGTITSRIWTGSPSHPEPGPCTAFGFDHTWRMQARGSVNGTTVTFGSRRATLVRRDCPSSDARYAPDNFTGTIRPLSETFESVNNDGAFDIDEPYTFRRVSCE